MPRKAHPWYRKSDGWWYVKLDGKQTKLAQGRENRQAAHVRWHELMLERAVNRRPRSGSQSAASIIDVYLAHIQPRRARRTYENCRHYL